MCAASGDVSGNTGVAPSRPHNTPVHKPYSSACERNQAAILDVLTPLYAGAVRVLEVGSGTGQHAVYFAAALPALTWQTSDLPDRLPGIRQWLAQAGLPNTPPPWCLDLSAPAPEIEGFDAVYTANTLHIMGWPEVEQLFERVPRWTRAGALVTVYGAFKYGGRFTSPSNAEFDAALRAEHPHRGLRDFEAVDVLARHAGLVLLEDRDMPAHNRCVTWMRRA
jgi:cyclopropane fatty-acyl-phospholipid synthase-like methyltransferase